MRHIETLPGKPGRTILEDLAEMRELEPRFFWRLQYLDGDFRIALHNELIRLNEERERRRAKKHEASP